MWLPTKAHSAKEIKNCVDDKIHPVIPPIDTQQKQKKTGRYTKEDFVYNEEQDEYTCPNGKTLKKKQAQAYPKAILGLFIAPAPQIARLALCTASAWQSKRLTEEYGGGNMKPLYKPIASLCKQNQPRRLAKEEGRLWSILLAS